MSNVIIELDSKGIQELLKSEEIARICEEVAEQKTRASKLPYVADVHIGETRVNAAGYETTEEDE